MLRITDVVCCLVACYVLQWFYEVSLTDCLQIMQADSVWDNHVTTSSTASITVVGRSHIGADSVEPGDTLTDCLPFSSHAWAPAGKTGGGAFAVPWKMYKGIDSLYLGHCGSQKSTRIVTSRHDSRYKIYPNFDCVRGSAPYPTWGSLQRSQSHRPHSCI